MNIEDLHINKKVFVGDKNCKITEIRTERGEYLIILEWDDGKGFRYNIWWDDFKAEAKLL